MKVYIIPTVDVFYYSYYIYGFYGVLGKKNVRFSSSEFPNFNQRCCALIVDNGKRRKKIIIDAFDSVKISSEQLEWCDIYAKVNYDSDNAYAENYKVIPIGPSFSIQIWSLYSTILNSISNYIISQDRVSNKREFFANYWRQYKRSRLSSYFKNKDIDENYIFFTSSLWKNEKRVNEDRYKFMMACKRNEKVIFEGGFVKRPDGINLGFKDIFTEKVTLKEYLAKIKKSILVFNTPAVLNCHGWKLAEFLALGKAIISAPHINSLPVELKDRFHLHYVCDISENSIEEAVNKLLEDKLYRKKLESNARQYFLENLSPEKIVNKILSQTFR